MVESHLIGAYADEKIFIKELNDFLGGWDYDRIEVQYRMAMNNCTNEVLFSALIIIKDVR